MSAWQHHPPRAGHREREDSQRADGSWDEGCGRSEGSCGESRISLSPHGRRERILQGEPQATPLWWSLASNIRVRRIDTRKRTDFHLRSSRSPPPWIPLGAERAGVSKCLLRWVPSRAAGDRAPSNAFNGNPDSASGHRALCLLARFRPAAIPPPVRKSAYENRGSLPTRQPYGLEAFADPASPSPMRCWRHFGPRGVYPWPRKQGHEHPMASRKADSSGAGQRSVPRLQSSRRHRIAHLLDPPRLTCRTL